MLPINIFNRIYNRLHSYQKCIGGDTLTKNFRPHALTIFFLMINNSFVVFNFYTLAAFDIVVQLKCMSIFGLGPQGIVKFQVVMLQSQIIYDAFAFLRNIYEQNRRSSQFAFSILQRRGELMDWVLRIGAMAIMSSGVMLMAETALESAQEGHRVPILNTMLPGLSIDGDENRLNYALVSAYHCGLVFLGCVGTAAVDMCVVLLVMHIIPMAEIFLGQLSAMDRALRQPVDGCAEFARSFRNLLLMHKEICQYLATISGIFYITFLVEIYTDALSLCVLIVCQIQLKWAATFPLAMLFMLKLFAYCFLGTIAEASMHRIYSAILTCDWYKLPIELKRKYLLMVLSAQRPATLMAGPMPLNLDTFVNTLKTIYSVGMLLIESID